MTSFAEVFSELNRLESETVISKYAIAGATAFLFYTEPVRTYDLDVFVFLPPQSGILVSMQPLYNELERRGYVPDAEHIMMHGTPVQFLPAYNWLAEEAVEQAVLHEYDGIPVRVVSPEHLIALALQTGGRHRRLRAETLLESETVDTQKLSVILKSHNISIPSDGDSDA